jgi:uncharacterized membrane protein YgdD (TMEM256/DUF423 family)
VKPSQLAAVAAGLLALGMGAAALGSHALAQVLDPDGQRRFQIATQILMWQALGVLALMRWAAVVRTGRHAWQGTGLALLAGTLLFCASVYALAFGAPRAVAALAPLGGLLMIGGWISASILLWGSRD